MQVERTDSDCLPVVVDPQGNLTKESAEAVEMVAFPRSSYHEDHNGVSKRYCHRLVVLEVYRIVKLEEHTMGSADSTSEKSL